MKVDQMLVRLAATFPGSFSNAQGAVEWGRLYRVALSPYEGPVLAAAYDETLAEWRNGYAPKPADFAAACNATRQRHGERGGRLNFGEGATRPFNWARYILANPGKYCADAERAARELLGHVAEAAE